MMGLILLLGLAGVFLLMFTEQGKDLLGSVPTSLGGSIFGFVTVDWDAFYDFLISNPAGMLYGISVIAIVAIAVLNILKSGNPVR